MYSQPHLSKKKFLPDLIIFPAGKKKNFSRGFLKIKRFLCRKKLPLHPCVTWVACLVCKLSWFFPMTSSSSTFRDGLSSWCSAKVRVIWIFLVVTESNIFFRNVIGLYVLAVL